MTYRPLLPLVALLLACSGKIPLATPTGGSAAGAAGEACPGRPDEKADLNDQVVLARSGDGDMHTACVRLHDYRGRCPGREDLLALEEEACARSLLATIDAARNEFQQALAKEGETPPLPTITGDAPGLWTEQERPTLIVAARRVASLPRSTEIAKRAHASATELVDDAAPAARFVEGLRRRSESSCDALEPRDPPPRLASAAWDAWRTRALRNFEPTVMKEADATVGSLEKGLLSAEDLAPARSKVAELQALEARAKCIRRVADASQKWTRLLAEEEACRASDQCMADRAAAKACAARGEDQETFAWATKLYAKHAKRPFSVALCPKPLSQQRVKCCDGSVSPSCSCDRTGGCCSHHGGVCGCL